jgi:hypothetical protein
MCLMIECVNIVMIILMVVKIIRLYRQTILKVFNINILASEIASSFYNDLLKKPFSKIELNGS